VMAGQSVGMVTAIMPVADILAAIRSQAVAALAARAELALAARADTALATRAERG